LHYPLLYSTLLPKEVYDGPSTSIAVGAPGSALVLQPNTAYVFVIRCSNQHGESTPSDPVEHSTLGLPEELQEFIDAVDREVEEVRT
jgi:hypothetical protein